MIAFIILREDKGTNIYEAPMLCQLLYQPLDSPSPRFRCGCFYSYNVSSKGKESGSVNAGQGWYPSQQMCAGDAETMVKVPDPGI